jgi:hypothetical protein
MGNNTTYYWRIDELGPGGKTTGTVWNFTTGPALPWSDGFESGNLTAGGWIVGGSASAYSGAGNGSTWGARIPGSTGANYIQKDKSTVGYNTIHVKYDRRVTSTSKITLTVQWSANGGSSWTALETVSGSTSWESKDYTLDPNANNNSDFRIRFITTAGSSGRYAYVDNVQITGTQNQYALTVSTLGSGTVTKSPDKAAYNPGEVVTLTANPSAGWSFGAWSGDAGGSDNPETVIMDGNKSVTAAFTQNEYTLTVNTVGNGTVAKSPDQATYHYGDTVQLTASAAVGWSFAAWSGDANGTSDPVTIIIDESPSVTAIFTQNEYPLAITIVGNGTVAKIPDQPTYHYGDTVQLDANAPVGWTFGGWSDDANGTSDPVTIIIVTMN